MEEAELLALRERLHSNEPDVRAKAAKRVVRAVRDGENVSSLYPSMLRCIATDDLALKRLVYHYLLIYSTQQPEQAIMTVNTLIKDSTDPNPIVRALAVRTMCRLKLDTVAEHMLIPLKKSIADKDPYVRKTAAIAVSKLYDVIPESVENSGLLPLLVECLRDENPMVISNVTRGCSRLMNVAQHRTFHWPGKQSRRSLPPPCTAAIGCKWSCSTPSQNMIHQMPPKLAFSLIG
jgi:vesicle coat complex subunit